MCLNEVKGIVLGMQRDGPRVQQHDTCVLIPFQLKETSETDDSTSARAARRVHVRRKHYKGPQSRSSLKRTVKSTQVTAVPAPERHAADRMETVAYTSEREPATKIVCRGM